MQDYQLASSSSQPFQPWGFGCEPYQRVRGHREAYPTDGWIRLGWKVKMMGEDLTIVTCGGTLVKGLLGTDSNLDDVFDWH